MTDLSLAKKIAAMLQRKPAAKLFVPGMLSPHSFIRSLLAVLPDTRPLVFDFNSPDPVRNTLLNHFAGDCLPDFRNAFEAGWRAHCTELALVSATRGMEAAAGLQAAKDRFIGFLDERGDDLPVFLGPILASFSLGLPTVIVAGGPHEQLAGFFSMQEAVEDAIPPVIVFSETTPAGFIPDGVLRGGAMSIGEIEAFLTGIKVELSPDSVMELTGGDAGCVRLLGGIKSVYPDIEGDLKSMLAQVFSDDRPIMELASAGAVLGERFLLEDAMTAAGLDDPLPFSRGKRIGLWKGHLVPAFHSDSVRVLVLNLISPEQLDSIYAAAALAVETSRPESAVALALAGEIHISAGMPAKASVCLEKAAELERSRFRAAHLYRRAAALDTERSEHLSFLSSLCFFREGMREEALKGLLRSVDQTSGHSANLRLLCDKNSVEDAFPVDIDPCLPDIHGSIVKARALMQGGRFQSAETLLARTASQGVSPVSAASLVEMCECLFHRNMFHGAFSVSLLAKHYSVETGLDYLESRALVTMVRAANRTGRTPRALNAVFRLLELAMISGNPVRYAHAFNLLANTLLLSRDYSRAKDIYQAAMRWLQDGEHNLRALILNNMSIAQRKLFLPRDALSSLMKLVHETVSAGDLHRACVGYGNLARLFIDLSEFDSSADCLETMAEMAALGRVRGMDEPQSHIAAQIAFSRGEYAQALELMDTALRLSRSSGNRRRLSLNLVRKGSMLLRAGMTEEAEPVLMEAAEVSRSVFSLCNAFVADMKLATARCLLNTGSPAGILSIPVAGNPDDNHRGEQFYHHWKLTGSRQSLAAAAQLLSRGLSNGLHHHSYMYMLEDIAGNLPPRLADALPLVHNYSSRIQMKGV